MSFPATFAFVLVLMTTLDAVWALYIRYTSSHKAMPAALSSVAIYAMGSVVTIEYVSDHRLIGAALIGSFLGTYCVVKWGGK